MPAEGWVGVFVGGGDVGGSWGEEEMGCLARLSSVAPDTPGAHINHPHL